MHGPQDALICKLMNAKVLLNRGGLQTEERILSRYLAAAAELPVK